jgi:hypothetical protein
MTSTTPINAEQKLTWIYSDHRQEEVLYRVHYVIEQKRGCKIYTIQRMEEIE